MDDYGAENKGLDRILALSDGIFAFSLTLLALNLVVPQITSSQEGAELTQKLVALVPNFIIFIWSFFIVSFYWFGHHRVFRFVKRYDAVLIWLNLVMLMFITLVPFFTNLNMLYGNMQVAVVVAAIFYSAPGITMSLLWRHSSNHHLLIDPGLPEDRITLARWRGYVAPIVFLLSIPFSFIHPYVTLAFWVMILPLRIVIERKFKVHEKVKS